MDDDEFAELYGSTAVDEPVQRPAPVATNGAVAAAYSLPPTATAKDDFEDLYGQSLGDDVSMSGSAAAQQHAHLAAGLSATPFAAAAATPTATFKAQQQPQQQQQQHPVPAAAYPAAAPAAAADDDDDEDFDILVDDDNGPTPVKPAAAIPPAAAAAPGGSFSKPPAAVAGASGRLSSAHLQYVRPGLEGQASLNSTGGQTHMMAAAAGGVDAVAAQRQSSMMSAGFGGPGAGAAGGSVSNQQYSLPLPGLLNQQHQQLPGPPAVPGPRPPAAPYPGPPADPAAGVGVGVAPGPRPPPGAPGAPPELNFIPMGQAGFQIAAAWRDVDASFPSAAGPQQPIKLPRQHNVDKEEYKEFLNLGHGEIFNLDLDRVTTAPWRAAGADISDFFNYGLTEKSWRQYMRQVAKYRAAYTINNKIEILSSDKADDDLEGLPREIATAVRTWRQQHPTKGASNNQHHPPQLLPRARGREYKRVADNSVVLTLVTAADEEDQQQQQQQQQQQANTTRNKHGVAGEYDGPHAGDVVISGVPDLPAHTIAPPSPRAAVPDGPGMGGPAAAADQVAGQRLLPGGSGAMMHQQMGDHPYQQHQLQSQLSGRADSDAAGMNGLQAAGEMQAAAAADMAAAGAGMQQGGLRPGRGLQVKLAARNVAEEQQQQQEPQPQFIDESEMMAEYYNEQLQHQASSGMMQQPGPDGMMIMAGGDDDELDEYDLGGYQQTGGSQGMTGVRKRHREHVDAPDMMMMSSGPAAQQPHLEDLDEFDDFTGMPPPQQQQQPGIFMNQMGPNPAAAMMGLGGFAGGMGMPGAAAAGMAGMGLNNMSSGPMRGMNAAGPMMMSDGPPAAAVAGRISRRDHPAAAGANWDAEVDEMMQPPPQQRHQQQRLPPQQQQRHDGPQQQQQLAVDDSYDGQGGFMGADGYDGDGYDGGWRGAAAAAAAGPGGQAPLIDDTEAWAGPGVPANACFNCGATDHLARNCPHPKHFNITCHNCGEVGHRAKDCPAPKRPPPGADQRCFKCGLEGHIARECPNPPRMGPPGHNRRGSGPHHPPPPLSGPPQPPPPPPRPGGEKVPPAAAGSAAGSRADSEQFDEGTYSYRGGPRSGGCFRCGQEGHIARDCPNPPASPKADRDGPQPPTCYNCGGEGHFARECPNGRQPHRGGEDRWEGGERGPPPHIRPGPGPCFNCGQEGHLARDCPAPPRGGPPPPRGPPPLLPPRSVFDRLGGPPRGPGPWDGPPPGRFETPEERAAREAEIDRRLREAEGYSDRERGRDVSPGRGPGSGSGRSVGLRDRERERERDAGKRSSRGAAAVDEAPRSGRGRDEEEDRRASSRRGSSRERKRSHTSRSPERKKDKKEKHSSKRDKSRSRSPGSRKSSKHGSRHRSRSHSKSRSRSRGRHRR